MCGDVAGEHVHVLQAKLLTGQHGHVHAAEVGGHFENFRCSNMALARISAIAAMLALDTPGNWCRQGCHLLGQRATDC